MALYILTGIPGVGKHSVYDFAQSKLQRSPTYIFGAVAPTEGQAAEDVLVSFRDSKGITVGYNANEILTGLEERKKVLMVLPTAAQITEVTSKLPENTISHVIVVTSNPDVLAERRSKNKEPTEIKKAGKVLKKTLEKFAASLVNIWQGTEIINDNTVEAAAEQLLGLIGFDPKIDIPPPDENDLKNCLPQDYLKRVVFPILGPGLTLLDQVRPNDPVEWLASYLVRESSRTATQLKELENAKRIRQDLRREMQAEFDVPGRI